MESRGRLAGNAQPFPRRIECLHCGLQRDDVEREPECPRCGYVGWAEAAELDESVRRRLRERPLASRRLRRVA